MPAFGAAWSPAGGIAPGAGRGTPTVGEPIRAFLKPISDGFLGLASGGRSVSFAAHAETPGPEIRLMSAALHVLIFSLLTAPAVVGAAAPARVFDKIGIAAAIALTVAGTLLQWYLPRHEMRIEEEVKNGQLPVEEMRRKKTFYRHAAMFATLTGALVLLFVLFDLAQ
jgi:hypothetical protein